MSFGFQSIEHAFASVAKAIGKGLQEVVTEVPKIQTLAAEIQPVAQVLTADLCPPAVGVENAAYSALSKLLTAIDKTAADGQEITPANVLQNVSLVDTEIKDLQGIGSTVKTGLVSIGVIKSPTQTLLTPSASGKSASAQFLAQGEGRGKNLP